MQAPDRAPGRGRLLSHAPALPPPPVSPLHPHCHGVPGKAPLAGCSQPQLGAGVSCHTSLTERLRGQPGPWGIWWPDQ